MKTIFRCFTITFLFFLFSSCFLQKQDKPADISIFSEIYTGEEWAVIIDPYAAFYTEPSKLSAIKAHGRRGDILEVTGKRITAVEQEKKIWYEFEKGWLETASITVFPNKIQAGHESQKYSSDISQ